MKPEQMIVVLLVVGLIGMAALVVLKPTNINLTGRISGGGGNTQPPENSIQVSGETTLNLEPNKAEVILGVETQEVTALDSQQKNAEVMEKIMNALRANGVRDEDIKTYNYNVYPIRQWNSKSPDYQEVIAYRTTNTVKIKTTDMDNIGKIIDAAAAVGANRFQGVNFGLTEDMESKYRNEALKAASENAHEKAEAIADGLGIDIKGVLRASESSSYQPVYQYYDTFARAGGAMEAETEISPGTIQMSATVSVSYEFV
jgi:hypothetical protein